MPCHALINAPCYHAKEKMTATPTFTCSICGEGSTRICARCTKDACDNHLCEKCQKCSDCCECDVSEVRDTAPTA